MTMVRWMESIGTLIGTTGDLRASAGEEAGEVVIAKGFWEAGDGGGGIFYWIPKVNPADPFEVPPDDGGTQIRAPRVNPAGHWQRVFTDELNVKWFGAKARRFDDTELTASTVDGPINSTAFSNAMLATREENYIQGIFVPAGKYHLTADLVIARKIKLFGAGREGSELRFAAGKGVRLIAPNVYGGNSEITELRIINDEVVIDPLASGAPVPAPYMDASGPPAGPTPNTGIVVHYPVVLSKLYISGFAGTGIRVTAGAQGNTIGTQIIDCTVHLNGGHGLDIGDGDSHNCLIIGSKFLYNGGTGIFEHSAACNVYIACGVEGNRRCGVLAGRNVNGINYNNTSTFYGCHAERGLDALPIISQTAIISGQAMWVGGQFGSAPTGATAFLDTSVALMMNNAANVSSMIFSGSVGGAPERRKEFLAGGDANHPSAAWGWQAPNDEVGGFWMEREPERWFLHWYGTGNYDPFYLTTAAHPRGGGVFGARALLIGNIHQGTDATRITRGVDPRNIAQTDPQPGDIVLNANPAGANDFVGWMYTNAGWRPFGRIEEYPVP
jgi:hypothetical protein